MKVLVTGAKGQLGYDICKELERRQIDYIATGADNLDVTDENAVFSFIKEKEPTHIIHCAGYTAVDKAENNIEECRKINVIGTENLVKVCKEYDIPLMYFSTDYVFGRDDDKPIKIDDIAKPKGVYAISKYDGELQVIKLNKFFIIRISWVYGKNGSNFVNTMMRLSNEKKEITVVNDQVGGPSYTVDIAKLVCEIIQTEKYGIYHVANEGYVSWADFAREIFALTGRDTKVIDCTTEEYKALAPRPKNSRFDTNRLEEIGFTKLPTWQDALKRYLKEKMWI